DPAIIIVSVDYEHCHVGVVFGETTMLGDFRLAAAVDSPWDRLNNNVWSAVVLQRVTPAIGQRIARENRLNVRGVGARLVFLERCNGRGRLMLVRQPDQRN